jgi:hypothetical protein
VMMKSVYSILAELLNVRLLAKDFRAMLLGHFALRKHEFYVFRSRVMGLHGAR